MRKILLDANFLVLPFQHSVDMFAELDRILTESYQLYTLNRTYNEARALEDGRYRQQVERLVEESEITVMSVEEEGDADTVLKRMVGEFVVCTNDADIRRYCRTERLPHIYLRQKSHLAAENLESAAHF